LSPFASKQQWQEKWGGTGGGRKYTCITGYPLSTAGRLSISFGLISVPSVADVWQLARWATSPARQPCLAVSPVTIALPQRLLAPGSTRDCVTVYVPHYTAFKAPG